MVDFNSGNTPSASELVTQPGGSNGSIGRVTGNGSAMAHAPARLTSHVHHPVPAFEPVTDGLLNIVGRQWYVIVLTTLLFITLGISYLLVTKPTYTAISTMTVEPLDHSPVGQSTAAQSDSTDFLDTQCVIIKSSVVLALAVDKIRETDKLRSTHTLDGIDRPLEYLKQSVDASGSKLGKAIDVTFASKSPDRDIAVVTAVVDAYQEYNSKVWSDRVKDYEGLLQQGQDAKQKQMADIQARMLAITREVGHPPNSDPGRDPVESQVQDLQQAKLKAMLETQDARNAYREAERSILGDKAKVDALGKAEKAATGASTDPQGQLKQIQDELLVEQAKLIDAQREYLPAHPIIQTIQRRIDQMTVAAVLSAKQWMQVSEAREDAMDQSLKEAQQAELNQVANKYEYFRLEDQLKSLKDSDEDLIKIRNNMDLATGAVNISILNPAEINDAPTPSARKTISIVVVAGLILGLGLACLRDWTDDRLRTQHAIQAVVGVPVLGTIPSITTAHTASDRGQIVHHDPFGDASESYRSLRTAIQFGLPPGAKTVVVTSPIAGDGKSTLISNLGIAFAQAGKNTLIVDADFRAPMQHRLFDLKDEIGMASVIAGAATIDQAIQHTDIDRLDILPCGPIPSNPAEMLNDPAFLDHLNTLADKYDLILIDSPPVTTVTDARILAASVDASLLVVRPISSTRKQTEAARDGLRSVGARLIGVAVNAVPGGNFGGTYGSPPRSLAASKTASLRGQSVTDDD